MSQPRQSKGSPVGGQFAGKSNPESEVALEGDQPTPKVLSDGTHAWYQHGNLHRTDGPAAISSDGTEWWYKNGQLHRTDGPAITFPDGYEAWYQNGQLHRGDGPAVTLPSGTEKWYRYQAVGESAPPFRAEVNRRPSRQP